MLLFDGTGCKAPAEVILALQLQAFLPTDLAFHKGSCDMRVFLLVAAEVQVLLSL